MAKKIILYSLSLLCLVLLCASTSKGFMEWWCDYRVFSLKLYYTQARYGDLFTMCYLPGFNDSKGAALREYPENNSGTHLYIIHDSYLQDWLKKENFKGVDSLITSDVRNQGIDIRIDSTKNNILVIESSERFTGWRFRDVSLLESMLRFPSAQQAGEQPSLPEEKKIMENFFNPNINQNLEFNLFDYECFIPLKSLKAKLNYKLFDHLSKQVCVSRDGKYLLLNETVDSSSAASSFYKTSDWEIASTTESLDKVSEYYKSKGFDKVYFTIVPNPVSIIDPTYMAYNHKIERIFDPKKLKSEFIDIYTLFKKEKQQLYRRDDSHWNNRGVQIFVDELNKRLSKESR